MKAVKGNKTYTIRADQKQFYVNSGFDILDDDGNIIAYGRGKTVSYEQYSAVMHELEQIKAENSQNNQEEAVDILKLYAKEHGIDLGKASTVSGIVKKIREFESEGA